MVKVTKQELAAFKSLDTQRSEILNSLEVIGRKHSQLWKSIKRKYKLMEIAAYSINNKTGKITEIGSEFGKKDG